MIFQAIGWGMKIVYLGGVKNGATTTVLVSHDKTSLEWEVQREKPTQNVFKYGGVITYTNKQEYDVYKLLVLTRDSEQKFFYVLESLQRAEIEKLSLEYWGKSETIGYIF